MDPELQINIQETRRQFFGRSLATVGSTLGLAALSGLEGSPLFAADTLSNDLTSLGRPGSLAQPHHPPKIKRVISLFMSGAPSQMDLFDHKPKMIELFDKDLPESIIDGQRLTTMTSGQARFPVAPSRFEFDRYGPSGAEISELLPHTAAIADRITIIKSMFTEAINHDPAMTFMQTGSQQPGRPSLGSWLNYGLGSMNSRLPAFMVMQATWTGRRSAQALFERLWGAGMLPSEYQGVSLRSIGDPVLYLSDPPGVERTTRRQMARLPGSPQWQTGRCRSATRKRWHASPSMRWRIGCRPRCRSWSIPKMSRNTSNRCTVLMSTNRVPLPPAVFSPEG